MIVVRNVFRLHFGEAKPALALWKEGLALMKKLEPTAVGRVLTDVTGPSYTLVFENQYESLTEFERVGKSVMGKDEWQVWYRKFVPLVESGHREIFNVVG